MFQCSFFLSLSTISFHLLLFFFLSLFLLVLTLARFMCWSRLKHSPLFVCVFTFFPIFRIFSSIVLYVIYFVICIWLLSFRLYNHSEALFPTHFFFVSSILFFFIEPSISGVALFNGSVCFRREREQTTTIRMNKNENIYHNVNVSMLVDWILLFVVHAFNFCFIS